MIIIKNQLKSKSISSDRESKPPLTFIWPSDFKPTSIYFVQSIIWTHTHTNYHRTKTNTPESRDTTTVLHCIQPWNRNAIPPSTNKVGEQMAEYLHALGTLFNRRFSAAFTNMGPLSYNITSPAQSSPIEIAYVVIYCTNRNTEKKTCLSTETTVTAPLSNSTERHLTFPQLDVSHRHKQLGPLLGLGTPQPCGLFFFLSFFVLFRFFWRKLDW